MQPYPLVGNKNRAQADRLQDTFEGHLPSDEDLMARLPAKDAGALELLFERYSRLALKIAFRIVRDYGEAEEVVQETFLHLFQRAALFDPSKGTARSWIAKIALRRALDRRLHLNRRGFYASAQISSLDDALSGATDLDREVGSKLNRIQLAKAFEELSEMQRRTLELFYFEGLELREISEKLNEPSGNIRHHFYRGLERLRKSAFVKELREN